MSSVPLKLHVPKEDDASTQKIVAVARKAGVPLEVSTGGAESPGGIPVPELVIGGRSLFHTNDIIRRVAQTYECGLLGRNYSEEAQVDSWLEWCVLVVDYHLLDQGEPATGIFDTLGAHLKERTFLVGQRLTAADISLSVSLRAPMEKKGLDKLSLTHGAVVRWLRTCTHELDRNKAAVPAAPATVTQTAKTVQSQEPKRESAGAAGQAGEATETVAAGKSKNEEKKKAKEDAKRAKEAEKKRREDEQKAAQEAKFKGPDVTLETMDDHVFGNLFIRSETKSGRTWTTVKELQPSLKGKKVWLRARVQTCRKQSGKLCFLTLRQNLATVQAVACGAELAGFAGAIGDESVVDIFGEVCCPEVPIKTATQGDVEVTVEKLFCIGRSQALPLQLADLQRSEADCEKDPSLVTVTQESRLNERIIDLRTAANQAIFRMQSGVCTLFREYLLSLDFNEIHTPKLISAASEGGADVFRVDYFGGNAYLAQSPQLYKQMVLMADMDRVFEIGPIFRSEKSLTHRHMTEFMGLDMEMTFKDHYSEVLDVLDGMFNHIFTGLKERFADEIEAVRKQYPFEDLKWKYPCLRFTYQEAIELLKEEGPPILEARLREAQTDYDRGVIQRHLDSVRAHHIEEDIGTEDEKVLGQIVRAKYGQEFYIIDKFPKDVRPFYSMGDPKDSRWANAYDFFLRGEEITSGAQRVHDPKMLQENAAAKGIVLHQPYVDAFKYGAFPHAGAGIGLERVVMLFLNLNNIRKTSLFPRDPKRLNP
jgi:aspartyl-tRNA synthetase